MVLAATAWRNVPPHNLSLRAGSEAEPCRPGSSWPPTLWATEATNCSTTGAPTATLRAGRDSREHCPALPRQHHAAKPARVSPCPPPRTSCKQQGGKEHPEPGQRPPNRSIDSCCWIRHQPPPRTWQCLCRHRVPCPPGTLHPGTGAAAAESRQLDEPPRHPKFQPFLFCRHQGPPAPLPLARE